MFGVIMVFFSTFFDEVANSVTKAKLGQKQISLYSIGVINNLGPALIFSFINFFQGGFAIAPASLPTLGLRTVLEIILTYLGLKAIELSDRSTYGFIRVLTIPMLLLVDFFLGYRLNYYQLGGMALIVFSLFIIFYAKSINKRGIWLVFSTAALAVATLSLYKYDISHYNSVASEQVVVYSASLIFLLIMAFGKARENPFAFLKQKIYFFQFLVNLVPTLANSYAYGLAPASVILSAYRSSSVFWSVASGKAYFKEKHLLVKIACLVLIVAGLILLIL